jgi:hypothetical protein
MAAILSGTTMYQDGHFLIQNYIFSSKKKFGSCSPYCDCVMKNSNTSAVLLF